MSDILITALHVAAENGYEPVVQLLMEKGADVEAKDEDGEVALHQAADNGHEAVVKLLIEKRADVETKENSIVRFELVSREQIKRLSLQMYEGYGEKPGDSTGDDANKGYVLEALTRSVQGGSRFR